MIYKCTRKSNALNDTYAAVGCYYEHLIVNLTFPTYFCKSTDTDNYLAAQIGHNINMWYPRILLVLGTVCNSLSFATFNRAKLKTTRTATLFRILAITDIVTLFIGLSRKVHLLLNFRN